MSKSIHITKSIVSNILPIRKAESHKGTYGRIGIIGGSKGMLGSVSLSSMAALRSGSGLVYLMIPRSLSEIAQIKLTEPIIYSIDDNNTGHLISDSIYQIVKKISNIDALALGPGMGVSNDRYKLISNILDLYPKPIVIDADGLNCLTLDLDILKHRKHNTILTPHIGEMSRLLNVDIEKILKDKFKYAIKLSTTYNVITVLKGNETIVCDELGNTYLNTSGNPGMATAGSGDVLTGIITSLIGQGISPVNSAIAGVFIHGLAGDLSADNLGEYGMIASDIIDHLPLAIKDILNFNK